MLNSGNEPSEVDRRRIRLGLAVLVIVVVGAVVGVATITDPLGRAIMVAVLVFTVVRTGLLVRSLRRP